MRWDLGAIERAFAEAALDPSRWDAAMDTAAAVTGVRGAALFPIRGRLPLMPHSASMGEGFEIYVRDRWFERDERYRGVPAALRRGVTTEFDFTTPDEINRNSYYQEFLAPQRFRWFAGILVGAADNLWSFSLQRTIAQGPFPRDEIRQAAALSARLSGVAAIARALGFAAISGAVEAFELSGMALVQLDNTAGVMRLNARAEKLIGHGISVINGRLVAERKEATSALDRALNALLWRQSAALAPPIALPRKDRPPLLAYPVSLGSVAENPFADCRALLVLVDPEQDRRQPPEALLRNVLQMTPAEARLAAKLATGASVEDAAEILGITKITARNQLRAVFAKAGVHRQAQLVAQLSAMLGPLIRTT
jgi:DNA-binding CsgD family transcriptional regulator